MTPDEKLLDKLRSYTYGLDIGQGSDHTVDALRYYVEAGTYGIGGVHCIDEEIPNTAAEKKVVHLARQNMKSVFDVPKNIISEYDSFANKRLTKKRFRKQLQACGFQRNDINKVLEDVKRCNFSYTLSTVYKYTAFGRYMPQLYFYARTANITPEEACQIGDWTIKGLTKGFGFRKEGDK